MQFHNLWQFQIFPISIVPDSSASGSRGRARRCRIPGPPARRPGRTAQWWHCSGSVCHLREQGQHQQPPLTQRHCSLLGTHHVYQASRHNQSQINPNHSNGSGCKLQLVFVFFRAPFGSESLKNVSFEEMHQVEREATATSRLWASFKWKQCLDLKLFIHLLRQVKQN